ncbi:OmpA family protein [Terriglobus tenax]|uniref:OmpA family protein n=1 Tax=Terriglobus tenax TaxID=1111115 RepID=UPI0021E0AE78|nr:OmpA family protein [Terriglobus tenax]
MSNEFRLARKNFGTAVATTVAAAGILFLTAGCSTKNYVRSQTAPIIQNTNDLDAKTAQDHRNITDTDRRAQAGIARAQGAADAADQHAMAAGTAADGAGKSAQEAYNRVDSLSGVVANLDHYAPVSDVTVTFGFDKSVLTASDKKNLDEFASKLDGARHYILEVTGGTDSTGDAQYNYNLSQKRADAVVNYLQTKYNVAPHKFYLIGIGKDQEVASNKTAAGRKQNRRVEVRLMSNMKDDTEASMPSGTK